MLTGPVPHGRSSPHDNGQSYPAHKSITGQDLAQLLTRRGRARRSGRAILGLTEPVPILVREDTLLWLVDVELVFANPAGISCRTNARIERIDGPLGGSGETKEAVISALESTWIFPFGGRAAEGVRMDEGESSVLARRARIKIVAGAKVSDDGSHMLLKLQPASQYETVLAIPINEAARLIDLVAYALTRSTELARHRRNKRRLFRALACTVGKEPLSEDVVLSIKLPSGGILSFRLQPSMAAGVRSGITEQLEQLASRHARTTH